MKNRLPLNSSRMEGIGTSHCIRTNVPKYRLLGKRFEAGIQDHGTFLTLRSRPTARCEHTQI